MTNEATVLRIRRKGQHPGVVVCLVVMGFVLVALGIFLIWRVRLAKQVSARIELIRKAGEPTDGRDLDSFYSDVAEGDNAAVAWVKGLEKLNPPLVRGQVTPWGKVKLPPRGGKLMELEKAAQVVLSNEEALRIFRKAAQMKQSRYAVDLSPGPNALLPHLTQIKSVGQLLRLEAAVAAERGRGEDASEAVLTILGTAGSLKNEPIHVSQLVRNALDAMAGIAAESALNLIALKEAQLSKLQESFEQAEDKDSLYRGMLGERASGITSMARPEDLKGLVATGNVEEDNSTEQDMKAMGSPAIRMTGFFERDLRFFLDAMATNIATARLPDPERFKSRGAFDEMVKRSRKEYFMISSMLLPALSKAVLRDVDHRAYLRASQTALAVERFRMAHGNLPASLGALTPQFLSSVPLDPVDGEPLRFKVLPRGYVVYSIGTDGQDDEGKPKPTNSKGQRVEHYDVTFTVERKETAK
jgi:hypothetical protein